MPTDLIEVHEYALEQQGDMMAYALVEATLHFSEEDANLWVSHRLRHVGTGEGVMIEGEELPGRAWSTITVQAVEWRVEVGQDLDEDGKLQGLIEESQAPFNQEDEYQGVDPEYEEHIRQTFQSDEPLPPDEH